MKTVDQLLAENSRLRERLSKLSEIGIRINESLEFDAVLQGVLDSARVLTDARYGAIALEADEGAEWDYIASGMTAEETSRLWKMPDGERIFTHLNAFQVPIRLEDLSVHLDSAGFDDLEFPVPRGTSLSFLAVPVRHMGRRVGSIFLAAKESAAEFTLDDEETLEMFASQAALVIANARTYRSERRAMDRLETLVNTSPVGVIVFDGRTGAPVTFNREARRIVESLFSSGQSPEDVVQDITFVRSDGREFSINEIPVTELLSSGETVRVEEVVLKVPDGRSVSTLINATPIRDDDGTVESCVVTLQDLTHIENLERLRAEFLGVVSHELRAPLAAVKGSAATLIEAIDDLEPVEMLQFFKIIEEETDRMRELIGELLQVARIEAGSFSVRPEPLDLTELIDDAKTRFISGGGRDRLSISLGDQLPRVMADRRRIVQVLNNLLSNAEKHSPDSSTILVAATQRENQVEISVSDRGRGISADALPHMFLRFADHAAKDNRGDYGGSGLGLAICKGIVEAHGGRIWADSEGLGLGAKFAFTLPAFEAATTETVPGSASSAAGTRRRGRKTSQERILAVDDDPHTLRRVRNALQKAGYVPVVTGDPEEAANLMDEHKPDLVLLDLLLPGIDGIELMKRISAVDDVPVIFLSAYRQDEVVTKAFELGAADYIVKPFSDSELVARIGAALRNRVTLKTSVPHRPYFRKNLKIDYSERQVTVFGRQVGLTVTEFNLLFELSANAGRVLTYDEILERVWVNRDKENRNRGVILTVVRRIRRKLGEDAGNPQHIFNVPGVGYKMMKANDDD